MYKYYNCKYHMYNIKMVLFFIYREFIRFVLQLIETDLSYI